GGASTAASAISFSISSALTLETLRCLPVVGTTVCRQMCTCASTIFMAVSSVRRRSARIEQFLALELAPQLARDLGRHALDVLLDLADAERAWDHRAERRVKQRELHGGRAQFDAMALADGLDLACLLDQGSGRLRIVMRG